MTVTAEKFYGGAAYHSFSQDIILRSDLSNRIRLLNPTAANLRAYLPNATGLEPGGPIAIIKNVHASNDLRVVDFEGNNIGKLTANNYWAKLYLLSGHSAAGSWKLVTSNGSADFAVAPSNPASPAGNEATTVAPTVTTASGATLANQKFNSGNTQAPELGLWGVGLEGLVPVELPRNPAGAVAAQNAFLVADLLTSDANAATAQDLVNRILGLRLDGESAMGLNGGSIRGVSYTRFIELEKSRVHHMSSRAAV